MKMEMSFKKGDRVIALPEIYKDGVHSRYNGKQGIITGGEPGSWGVNFGTTNNLDVWYAHEKHLKKLTPEIDEEGNIL